MRIAFRPSKSTWQVHVLNCYSALTIVDMFNTQEKENLLLAYSPASQYLLF